MKMRVLSTEDVKKVVEMKPVIKAVEQVYMQKGRNEAVVWPTVFYEFEPGVSDMDIKSGYLKDAGLFGHKTVSLFTQNQEKGLPELLGCIMVFDAATGAPLGLLDGSYITGVRTGATGAIGAKYLARKDSKTLFILGAGHQATFQVAAMLTEFPQLETIYVADPIDHENAVSFVNSLPQRLKDGFGIDASGISVRAAGNLAKIVPESDIIITVTLSKEPRIKKEWVSPGTHFSCIGADMAGKEEIDPALFAGAVVFVDDKFHCIEAGELEIPLKKGMIEEGDIAGEIGSLILGDAKGRISDEQITIYDATGMALLDIAAAKAALELAEEKGLGQVVEI